MNPKKTLLTCLLAVGALGVAGIAHADITIGAVQSLTGPASGLGIPIKNALALWPKTVAGEKIDIIVLDDASDPTTGAKAVQRLVTDSHVDVIVGPAATPIGPPVADAATAAGTPVLSTTPADLPPGKDKWFFRLPQSTDVMAYTLVQHMQKQGVKTLGFLGYADAYGELWLKSIDKLLAQNGIKMVDVERFARSDTSVTAQALKLVTVHPDAIVIIASGSVSGMPQRAVKERGYRGTIYQTHSAATPDFIRTAGKDAEGTFLVTGPAVLGDKLPASNPSRASSIAFIDAYEKVYGPNSRSQFAGHGWDAYTVLAKALPVALKKDKPGTPEFRAALRDAFEHMGPTAISQGVINWTPADHWGFPNDTGVMVQVVDGQFKVVP
jgi:branched-chain amino acid transport system substrate-binding protein